MEKFIVVICNAIACLFLAQVAEIFILRGDDVFMFLGFVSLITSLCFFVSGIREIIKD